LGIRGGLRPKSVYRFAAFELHPALGELRKHGYRIPLQDQPFRILCLLLDSPAELVTREQIRETLWAAHTFVDFDRSLNKAMVKLRQALDDDADAPRFIETLPKRGYRFLIPVELVASEAGADSSSAGVGAAIPRLENQNAGSGVANSVTGENAAADVIADDSSARAAGPARRIIRWTTRGLAGVAGVMIVLWLAPAAWRDQLMPPIFRSPIRSLAVLPLENLSGDPNQQYFVDGMTDELTTSLAHIPSLRVVSHTTMNQYHNSHKPIPEIGRELQVDAVIEGSVVRSGDKVRITTKLIDAPHDRLLWAQSYENTLTDVLEVQDMIALDVASQVKTKVDTGVRGGSVAFAALRAPVQPRPNAYDDLLRGRSELTKQNPEAMKKAAEYFQAAIDDDPDYARAYAGLADSYNLMANFQVMFTAQAYPRARAAAMKALELDPDLAQAHLALARVKHHFEWDWAGAEVEYKRTIELNPNYSVAHYAYAWFLTDVGRFDDAMRELHRAQELDPGSIIVATNLGRTLYHARRYDEAIVELQRAVAMDPSRRFSHTFLRMAYEGKGMCPEALNEVRTIQTLIGGADDAGSIRVYAMCGRADDAHRALAVPNPRTQPVEDWVWTASAYAALGEKDRAFQWMEKGFEHRDFFLTELRTNPYFDPLRSDPRFQKLLDRMKFPT
jgi:TolB-like protein/DNA-binding winged helix-turn-helix (wHTH) protein/Tfp pilus assembly protein PilF